MQFNFECYLYLVVYMIVRFQFMMLTELQLIIFSAIDLLVDVCAYGFACLLASCDYSAEVELDCPHFIPIEVQILPLFQITGRFGKPRYIVFLLCIQTQRLSRCIAKAVYLCMSKRPTIWNRESSTLELVSFFFLLLC